MRLLLLVSASAFFSLAAASCCTPECCCAGCTSCNNPITDRCNSYSCTTYDLRGCGSYQGPIQRLQPSTYIQSYSSNGNMLSVQQQGGCNCKGQPPVATQCICPDNQQGTVVAINGGTRVIHKDTCYGYDYCLLGLPGWVTIICSILLLLIFIILLFYCISCLVHYLII